MKKAKCDARISRRSHGVGLRRATMISCAWLVRASDLALGVGDALDQVVAALVGSDLAGEALLDLDVELVGPREMPRLIDRRTSVADIRSPVPDLEDGGNVAPRRPAELHCIA